MKLLKKLKYILLLIIFNNLIFSEENLKKINTNPDTEIQEVTEENLKFKQKKYGKFILQRKYEKKSSDEENEKIGLSLGGGSAKGLAHIGILRKSSC